MTVDKPYPPTKIAYTDWDNLVDAGETRLGADFVGDLYMFDTTAIKTGTGASDYFEIQAVDNDTSTVTKIGIVQGASDPYIAFGGLEEVKITESGSLTYSSLTAGRVVFAGASGLLTDDADMTFATDTLTVTKLGAFEAAGAINFASQNLTNVNIDSGTVDGITSLTVANSVDIGNFDIRALSGTFDSLTAGRVPFASTNGLLVDDSDFTFATDTLTVTKIIVNNLSDLNGGADIEGTVFIDSSGTVPLSLTRVNNGATTGSTGAIFLTAQTDQDMASGFGPSIIFRATDSGATNQLLGIIASTRTTADDNADLLFYTRSGGAAQLALTINIDKSATFGAGITATAITDSGLTSGRIPIAGVGGLLGDDADLTFSGDTLTATKIAATTFTGAINMDGNSISNAGSLSFPAIGASGFIIGKRTSTGDAITINTYNLADASTTRVTITGHSDQALMTFSAMDLLLDTNNKLQFRDSAIYIQSADDGHMDLTADTSIDLNALTVMGGNITLGTYEIGRTRTDTTLGAAATTFAAAGEYMQITGDAGANTVATITGGTSGQLLTIVFVDGLVTITDTDAHTANTVDLAGTATDFVSADDAILQLVFDGTSWYEVSRSVN